MFTPHCEKTSSATLVACLLFLSAIPAFAQTAQITGRISDTSDAVIVGAKVNVTNAETGIRRTATANGAGYFAIAALPRGSYTISVSNPSFKSIEQTGINLDEGQVLRQDFTLQVGAVAETVEVTAQATLIERDTTSTSTVLTNQKILDLPLEGRNHFALVDLAPGVQGLGDYTGLPSSSFGGSRATIGGGPPSTNNYMVDGAAAELFTSGGYMAFLSVDATAEVRIITGNASAEYGRTSGGVMNVISKSGTNAFHGSAYEFLRNKVLNANSFFGNRSGAARPAFNLNQFGATTGGPVIRNKVFFFANWEQFKQRTVSQTFRTVPTDAIERGDFNDVRDSTGKLIQIYDPATTHANPASPGNSFVRDPFPNNTIPLARISPIAAAVMKYYPKTNQDGGLYTHANNFFGQGASQLDKYAIGIKLDRYFSEARRRLSGRFTFDDTSQVIPNFYGNVAETGTSNLTYKRRSLVLNYVHVVGPTLLVESSLGFNRYAPLRMARSYGFDVTSLGMPAYLTSLMQIPMFPLFNLSDVSPIGGGQTDHLVQASDAFSGTTSLTWFHGRHTIKSGFEERVYRYNNSQGGPVLQFTFDRTQTRGPVTSVSSSTAGYDFAGFLLGVPSGGTLNRYPTSALIAKYSGLYLQDDWKIHPRLSLNVGVRWEYEGAPTDRFNAMSNFDPSLVTTVNGVTLKGGLIFPGINGVPRGMRDNYYNHFSPRFGFAYRALDKTVVRGGFGVYQLPGTGIQVTPARTGYELATSLVASANGGATAANTLADPFPKGIQLPPGNSQGALTGIGTNANGNLRSLKLGYMLQWSFNIQHAIKGGWLIEAGYAGTHGVKLPANRSFHYLQPSLLSMGAELSRQVANPYYGIIPTGSLSGSVVSQGNLLQSYPQFQALTGMDSVASSIYHAGQIRAERRFSRGFSVLLSYTKSKLIDTTLGNGTNNDFIAGGSNGVQDWDDLRSSRAVSTIDIPQKLVIATSWRLPMGKKGNRVYKRVASGWQINSVLSLRSGNPIGLTAPAPSWGGNRPNVVGDPNAGEQTLNRWFNTAAFALIPAYTLGNAGRNLPSTRTDRAVNWDVSMTKDIKITDKVSAQFRPEFFNATNSPVFGTPGSTVGSATFGVVSSTANAARRIQFGLKVLF